MKGATQVCIFDGIMHADLYINILQQTILPFIHDNLQDHRFMQDNDPKHTSLKAGRFMADSGINWWKTPPESPDINPIENLWHELKEYIRREAKPKTKEELIEGIKDFWKTVNQEKCAKYIRHLRKVIPKIIEVHGEATGY